MRPRARRSGSRPVALVTGGGTGLGRAIARRLAGDGYDLVLASRSLSHLREGERSLRAIPGRRLLVPTDVRKPEEVDAMVQRIGTELGRLDLLVNNAAGNFVVRAEDLTPNGWRAVLGIVLDGAFYTSRSAFPWLKHSPQGSIVNIVAAYPGGAGPGMVHSAAAKAGVVALTRTLAIEWARYGIRVNALAPGPVRTDGTDRRLWDTERKRDRVRRTVPLGRFGRPEEIADAVSYLAGPSAGFVTGSVLTIDGGQSIGRGVVGGDPAPAGRPPAPRRRAR